MEPTLPSSVLLKAAAAGANLVAKRIGAWTVRWRVAYAVSRSAKRMGIKVAPKTLRRWLQRPDAQEQLSVGSAHSIESALRHLTWLMPGDEEQRQEIAETVLFLVYQAFLESQEPSKAVALAAEWQRRQTAADGQLTREVIAEAGRSLHERLAVSQTFDDNLAFIHPWRQEQARTLRKTWPHTESLVSFIATADEPGRMLSQWANEPPAWYQDAPPDGITWLGQLAMDYQQYPAASKFLSEALHRGAYPSAYWRTLLALCLHQGGDSEAADGLLRQTAPEHDLAAGMLALHHGRYEEGIAALTGWQPESDYDRALKTQLLARLTVGSGNLDRAVEIAVGSARESELQVGGLLAAELLLSRSRFGHSLNRLHDTEVATSLAVHARNARRQWKGDSAEATLVAVKAAVLSGDPQKAWRLIRPHPEGEATETEAQDPRLRRQAAELAAWHGDWERALEIAAALSDEFLNAEIAALRSENEGDRDQAVTYWHEAAAAASEPTDTLRVAMSLAEMGAELPNLGELETTHPEVVKEIRLVKRVMSASGDQLSALRAGAPGSIVVTLKLAEHLNAAGEHVAEGEVLQAGAERWTQPRMMLMSAYAFRAGKAEDRAASAANASLEMGGRHWAGEFAARALLFELYTDAGQWERSTKQARILVSLDPNSIDARWALAHSLARRGDLEGAWAALQSRGSALPPRDRDEALLWGQLSVRLDEDPGLVTRILDVVQKWPDDEQLGGILLGLLVSSDRKGDIATHPDDLAALNAATRDYSEQFPESHIFKMMTVTENDPLAEITPELKERHEALEVLATRVQDGSVPLGVAAELGGRTYTEASIHQFAGFVRCHDPNPNALAGATLDAALGSVVVIDITAVRTVALLPPDVGEKLRGSFSSLTTTDSAFLDALRAAESLGLRSTMSISWDPETQSPTIRTVDAQEADDWASEAEAIVDVMNETTRRPWAKRKSLPPALPDWDWLAALDLAATEDLAFWCDDAVLRQVARQVGVVTFDSVELLRLLVTRSQVDWQLADASEAILLSRYYADLGYKVEVFELAAAIAAGRPAGAAFGLTRPVAWRHHPSEVVKFALRAAEMRASESLADVEGWLTSAAIGISRIADDADEASGNLQILLGMCFALPWMTPERVSVAVRAVRAPLDERPDIPDPLQPVLRSTYSDLVAKHGHDYARPLLMSLVHYLPEPDRYAAARVILTHTNPRD